MRKKRIDHIYTANMSLYEIAEEMGISYQRVWSIERQALAKIKDYLLKRFGNSVTLSDVLPTYKEVEEYEMFKL